MFIVEIGIQWYPHLLPMVLMIKIIIHTLVCIIWNYDQYIVPFHILLRCAFRKVLESWSFQRFPMPRKTISSFWHKQCHGPEGICQPSWSSQSHQVLLFVEDNIAFVIFIAKANDSVINIQWLDHFLLPLFSPAIANKFTSLSQLIAYISLGFQTLQSCPLASYRDLMLVVATTLK